MKARMLVKSLCAISIVIVVAAIAFRAQRRDESDVWATGPRSESTPQRATGEVLGPAWEVTPQADEPTLRSSIPASEPEWFTAKGRVVLLGHDTWEGELTLTWTADRDAHTVTASAANGEWKHELPATAYALTSASLEGDDLSILGSPMVSSEAPVVDIELARADECVLDAYSSADSSRRIDRLSVLVDPTTEAIAGATAWIGAPAEKTTKITRGGSPVLWVLSDTRAPCVLPVCPESRAIRVRAEGFRDLVIEGVAGAGVHRVELDPARRLVVDLDGGPTDPGRFDMCIRLSNQEAPLWRCELDLPTRVAVDLDDSERVELTLTPRLALGVAPPVEHRVEFPAPAGDTLVRIDLPHVFDSAGTGTLSVTLHAMAESAEAGNWRVELLNANDAAACSPQYHRPSSRVARWLRTAGPEAYSREFTRIAAGNYHLVVLPIGLGQDVVISDNSITRVVVVCPGITTLRVAPVDRRGAPIHDGAKLGALIWRYDGDMTAAAPRPLDGDGELVVSGADLVSSAAHLAGIEDGVWVIRAASGRAIIAEFRGPRAFGAAALRVELVDGPMEDELRFANL